MSELRRRCRSLREPENQKKKNPKKAFSPPNGELFIIITLKKEEGGVYIRTELQLAVLYRVLYDQTVMIVEGGVWRWCVWLRRHGVCGGGGKGGDALPPTKTKINIY